MNLSTKTAVFWKMAAILLYRFPDHISSEGSGMIASSFYNNKKVIVTGGAGFLARHLLEALRLSGAKVYATGRRPRPRNLHPSITYLRADCSDRKQCLKSFEGIQYLFHLAAAGSGFHANLNCQAKLLTDNMLLNTAVMDAAAAASVERYLFTSSIAVYPADLNDPTEEDDLNGPPHAGEQYYAWAKRLGEIQARAYFEQFQIPVAIVRPANPYGPGDDFNPRTAHVIPALIRRVLSGEKPLTVWGTGRPLRSFIYADDVVRGMLLALEKAADCNPINLATGDATSIAELVRMIARLAGRDEKKQNGY
ncbi:MAG: NAD-dependent epimerase/dehydratase family protein [Desulfosarcinaceae bacterium]